MKSSFLFILMLASCSGRGQEYVVSEPFSLCVKTDESISVNLRQGIDAVTGKIQLGHDHAGMIIDAFPYYPLPHKASNSGGGGRTSLRALDAGEYTVEGNGKMNMSLSVYKSKNGRTLYVVLSGPAGPATAKSIERIREHLCVCGSCQ